MNIYILLQYLLIIKNTFSIVINTPNKINKNSFKINNIDKKSIIYDDIKKMSILSKLIYEYDFLNEINDIKKDYKINLDDELPIDILKKNNMCFGLMQSFTYLDNKHFFKKNINYHDLFNKYFKNTEIYGYFCSKDRLYSLILLNHNTNEITVIFRGSQYLEEWIQNLKIYETEILFNKKYKIHNGIYNMYKSNDTDENIIYILKNLFNYYPKYRKILTGHSRGGICSILLAFELLTKLKIKYNFDIYTFGSPPIFNEELSKILHNNNNLKIYNIINESDIIGRLPFINKYQIGNEIEINNNDITVKNNDSPYKVKNKIRFNNIFLSITNHDLNNYIHKIFNYN